VTLVSANRLILTEGAGDEAFFEYLIKERRLTRYKTYRRKTGEAGGEGDFLRLLRAHKGPATGSAVYKLLLIVADNDGSPDSKFRNVTNQIRQAGDFAVPARPRQVAKNAPFAAVAVLMLPWDQEPGNLESLSYVSARSRRRKTAKCIRKFVDCVGIDGWEESQRHKLNLRCLLASSCPTDPNTSLQHAWGGSKGRPTDLIPLDHACFDKIVNWLRNLRI